MRCRGDDYTAKRLNPSFNFPEDLAAAVPRKQRSAVKKRAADDDGVPSNVWSARRKGNDNNMVGHATTKLVSVIESK